MPALHSKKKRHSLSLDILKILMLIRLQCEVNDEGAINKQK